jgi:hypothetical protein
MIEQLGHHRPRKPWPALVEVSEFSLQPNIVMQTTHMRGKLLPGGASDYCHGGSGRDVLSALKSKAGGDLRQILAVKVPNAVALMRRKNSVDRALAYPPVEARLITILTQIRRQTGQP